MESPILRRHGAVWKTLWSRLESYESPRIAILKWMRIFTFFERQLLQKTTKIQNDEIPYTTATWSNVEDAAFSANRNDKRILVFYFKIKNMQNHEIPYTTATWGSVEDALEPARKLSVVVDRHTKMDAYFCVDRVTNFAKQMKT